MGYRKIATLIFVFTVALVLCSRWNVCEAAQTKLQGKKKTVQKSKGGKITVFKYAATTAGMISKHA